MARAIRNAIRANRFAWIIRNWNPYFYSASGRFARITRISDDSHRSRDSRRYSCESIRANHATKAVANVLPLVDLLSVMFWVWEGPSGRSDLRRADTLSDPTEIPPYRETGVAIPLSHCLSCGIADYRCYTPTSFLKNGLSQSKDRA